MKKFSLIIFTFFVVFIVSSCQDNTTEPVLQDNESISSLNKTSNTFEQMQSLLDAVNVKLESEGLGYRVLMAEYITNGEGNEIGNTVIAKFVGNKQLTADFVPFDPNREAWSGPVTGSEDNITYAVDQTIDAVPLLGGLTAAQTTAAIDRAMSTWENVPSTTLPIFKNSDGGFDLGYVAAFLSEGAVGSYNIVADIQHCGWRDLDFSVGILGVTYTLIWVDGEDNPTDIDNNGKADVAFREIYYDPSYGWVDDGVNNFDVESIALHETGHGLSQAHFGTISIKNDGSWKASPRALMNPFYFGPLRELLGTDVGGHSSIWASWPNK